MFQFRDDIFLNFYLETRCKFNIESFVMQNDDFKMLKFNNKHKVSKRDFCT